jgi:hypothetical protein
MKYTEPLVHSRRPAQAVCSGGPSHCLFASVLHPFQVRRWRNLHKHNISCEQPRGVKAKIALKRDSKGQVLT